MKLTFKTAGASLIALPLVAIGGMASAGGLAEPVVTPAPAPVIAPAPVPVGTDWTGFYAGAQLGYGQLDSDTFDGEPDGVIGGVHGGYLYDLGNFVLGGEIDYDGSNIEDDDTEVELDYVARAKLIAGYDAGAWLPYLTIGAAQAGVTVADDEVDDTGAFAGLGVKYRMSDSLSLGGEVLQHQFEEFNDGDDIDATTATARVSFHF